MKDAVYDEMTVTQRELERKTILLKLAGGMINALLDGLGGADAETRRRVMEGCGVACAHEEHWGPAIEIADRIASEEPDEAGRLERTNREIQWCGKWTRVGGAIQSTCTECGCLLVNQGVVKMNATLCLCSRGWVKTIFETLLGKPVRVELEKAIGRGDDICRYVVQT